MNIIREIKNLNYITAPQYDRLIQGFDNKNLVDVLIEEQILDRKECVLAFSAALKLPVATLDDYALDESLFLEITPAFAHKHQCVPIHYENDCLTIAVSEYYNPRLEYLIANAVTGNYDLLIADSRAIANILESDGLAEKLLHSVSHQFRGNDKGKENRGAQAIDINQVKSESPTVSRLIHSLILDALQKRASDIHIQNEVAGVTAKYRIDGVIQTATQQIDQTFHPVLVARLKVMADLDTTEKRIPQDGKFQLSVGGEEIDFRVSILPGLHGEDVVLRILDKRVVSADSKLRLADLGFSTTMLHNLQKAIAEPHGMVLVTGPTGSGKTTTLYAMLNEINDGSQKIITIEDPVEYQLPGIVQIPVNEKKQLTFSKGLRSILRHDPDKIMVGEIRDSETAEIAIQSALTGHLVFSTVHANNAIDVVSRFSHMGVNVHNFLSSLNVVVAQRLVRMNCKSCNAPAEVSTEFLEYSGLSDDEFKSVAWHKGSGCEACQGTGYKGRTSITEYLKMNSDIQAHLIAGDSKDMLLKLARESGFKSLRDAALRKAIDAEISLEEVNRVTFNH